MRRIKLGEFEIVSNKATISDPCYEPGIWCAAVLDNVLNGTWTAVVATCEDDRIDRLIAFHGKSERVAPWDIVPIMIGVDSGQAGIFDAAHYQDDEVAMTVEKIGPEIICPEEPWYSMCCDRTLNTEHSADVVPFGCVSSSGYGDGSYHCYVKKDGQGYIVGIMVEFISEVATQN